MASCGEKLAEVLFFTLIDDASSKNMQSIAEILHLFKQSHGRSYNSVKRQPFAAHLIEAMEEALQYSGWDEESIEEWQGIKAKQEAERAATAQTLNNQAMMGG